VIRTDNGYIVKGSPSNGNSFQLQLKKGKAKFHIQLPDYAVGDSYTLSLTSAGGPFSYMSSNKFEGNEAIQDQDLSKNIPAEGSYQLNMDYDNVWEIDITQ